MVRDCAEIMQGGWATGIASLDLLIGHFGLFEPPGLVMRKSCHELLRVVRFYVGRSFHAFVRRGVRAAHHENDLGLGFKLPKLDRRSVR